MSLSSTASEPYELGALPLARPVMAANTGDLIAPDSEAAVWCRDRGLEIGAAVEAAVGARAIRSVQGYVPGKGVRIFVDATTFVHELEAFLAQVSAGAQHIHIRPSRRRLRAWARR